MVKLRVKNGSQRNYHPKSGWDNAFPGKTTTVYVETRVQNRGSHLDEFYTELGVTTKKLFRLITVNKYGVINGSKCVAHPFTAFDALSATKWSPPLWGLEGKNADAKAWSPTVAGARVGADGNLAIRFVIDAK